MTAYNNNTHIQPPNFGIGMPQYVKKHFLTEFFSIYQFRLSPNALQIRFPHHQAFHCKSHFLKPKQLYSLYIFPPSLSSILRLPSHKIQTLQSFFLKASIHKKKTQAQILSSSTSAPIAEKPKAIAS